MKSTSEKNLPFLFVPLPRSVYDDAMKHMNGSEIKVYLTIIRNTYMQRDKQTGKRKTEATISIAKFVKETGIEARQVKRALSSLSDPVEIAGKERVSLVRISGPKGRSRTYEALMELRCPNTKNVTADADGVPKMSPDDTKKVTAYII